MKDLKYTELIAHMLEVLPEMRDLYERKVKEYYGEGLPHVVYGSILGEYADELAEKLVREKSEVTARLLDRVFVLIEQLSASSDFEVRCVAEASFLEHILGEAGGQQRFDKYMGPETKKLARSVAIRFGLKSD